jgi:hypothetical protein
MIFCYEESGCFEEEAVRILRVRLKVIYWRSQKQESTRSFDEILNHSNESELWMRKNAN